MSAESPRHGRAGAGAGGPLTVASQPPSDRSLIDTVSGFLSDVSLSAPAGPDSRDSIQWAHFETADVNEPTPEGDEAEAAPLLLVLGYGSGVQVWLIPPNGEAQEVLSWRQGSVRALRILPTPSGGDSFAAERPLLALCDSAGPQPLYCSLSFVSLRRGEQVKSIKFKTPILEVLANKRSVVVAFPERFAVFDAGSLEDRLAVTTCYPCPCPLGGAVANPLALGDRWLAYADRKLNSAKRSSGGCEGEGVTSYTATVLHAAKSLSKGLRGLGETVASSFAGGRTLSQSPSPPSADHQQPGVVTILDIEGGGGGGGGEGEESGADAEEGCDATVAHFVAHSDAIISLKFDASGMLLLTADKRGHDFHVFRVQPHPCHPALAAVHHLYILHRGDTTARVQDIAISADSRWAAVSTLRGTTHVFPISPYGGPCGVRTHTQPRVVNRLSRFHRSAGLPIHAQNTRSSSPVGDGIAQGAWFPNPRLPPYPLPTSAGPLAQLRPMPAAAGLPTHTITRNSSGRQRLSSLSEDTGGVPLLACARWGAAPPSPPAAAAPHARSSAAQSLYVMAATGHLLHYLIHPRHAAGVAKEKVCDDTPLELGVELVAQWPLSRPPAAPDTAAPLPPHNPLLHRQHYKGFPDASVSEEERWLAQVEIVTHAGPHRRLWMGPQFVFKTYNATLSGSSSSLLEAEAVEVEAVGAAGAARSPPVNMPGARPIVPVLIDSGSASSLEHSPSDSFRRKSFLLEAGSKPVGDKALGDVQLREDLAEAMRETEHGGTLGIIAEVGRRVASVARAVDPLGTVVAPGEDEPGAPTQDDPDLYTQANTDEALFRPVVRAPAVLPPPSDLSASPLPAGTTIPVQNLLRSQPPLLDDYPEPLKSEVVIPAALTYREADTASHVQNEEEPSAVRPSVERIINVPIDSNAQENTSLEIEVESIDPPPAHKLAEKNIKVLLNQTTPNYAQADVAPVMSEKENPKWSTDRPSAEGDVIETVDSAFSVCVVKDNQTVVREKKRFKPPTNKPLLVNSLDSSTDTAVVEVRPKCTSGMTEHVSDTITADKPVKNSKISQKVKSRNQIPAIPLKNEEPLTSDSKNEPAEWVEIKKEAILESKSKESLHFNNQLSNPKPSIRKHNEKSVKIKEKVKEIEEKENMDEEYVQFNVTLNMTKDEYREDKESVNVEDYTKPKSKSETIEDSKTEDQIWAMLSENNQEDLITTVSKSKDSNDDIKLKPRKSKKNRTKVLSSDSNTGLYGETEETVKGVPFAKTLITTGDFVIPWNEPAQEHTLSSSLKEENNLCMTNLVSNLKISKGSNKSKSLSPDTRRNAKIVKEMAEFKKNPSIQPENICVEKVIDHIDKGVAFKSVKITNEPDKTTLPHKSDGTPIESFDLPIDFDSYLVSKDKETEASFSKGNKDATIQQLLSDSVCSLQPSKSKKPNRKDRLKKDDFVSLETFETIEKNSACVSDKNTPLIIDLDKELNSNSKIKMDESVTVVIDSAKEEFPSIGSLRSARSHKRSVQLGAVSQSIPPIKSYSSIAAVSSKLKDTKDNDLLGLELVQNIVEPPRPCRPSLHEKLVELCKIPNIAVAECDAPGDLTFINDDEPSLYELPPLDSIDFSLDEFKLEVMRDSLLEVKDKMKVSPICKINIDDILFNIEDMASKKVDDTMSCEAAEMTTAENQDISILEDKSESVRKKADTAEGEIMEKSSDDDNTSPVSSQTESDEKEDKKSTATSSSVLSATKTSGKKKPRQKKKK